MKAEDWIKIEDRLPDVDVNVIALTSRGKVMVTSMYIPKDCRGKTTLEITYRDSIAIDSTVVYKVR